MESAESNTNFVAQLVEHLAHRPPGPPARIVIVARSMESWWDSILKSVEKTGILADETMTLDKIPLNTEEREAHFNTAMKSFAFHLGIREPFIHPPSLAPEDALSSPLLIHLTALLHVLAEDDDDEYPPRGRQLIDALLRRESESWETAFASLSLDRRLREDIVALASLATADTHQDAKQLLRSLDDLKDSSEERLGSIASALADLYPGEHYINAVEPEILTERLVVRRLLDPDTLETIHRHLCSARQVAHMLDVLNRAARNPLAGDTRVIISTLQRALGHWLPAFVARTGEQSQKNFSARGRFWLASRS
ncbi:MAG: hypothetical protein ACRD0K_01845 [Egibacteraceae bacterium]